MKGLIKIIGMILGILGLSAKATAKKKAKVKKIDKEVKVIKKEKAEVQRKKITVQKKRAAITKAKKKAPKKIKQPQQPNITMTLMGPDGKKLDL